MKKLFFSLIILFFHITLFSLEENNTQNDLAYFTGLRAAYSDAKVVFSDTDMENSLISMVLALEVRIDIFDYLSLGLIAGYNWNHFKDPLQVTSLPLSLEIDNQSNNSMVFGLNLMSEFFSSGDFSISARGEFLYFKQFERETEINLDIVTGSSLTKHWFYQGTLDMVLKYHGLNAIILYAGPQLNIIKGTLTISETIEEIEAEIELKHRQKNLLGIVGGLVSEFARNWEAGLEINYFSKLTISASIFYSF